MPDPNPAALDFLETRRSRIAKTLAAPAPDRDTLRRILTAAVRVPDHGKLEPWRLIVLEGQALARLADTASTRAEALGFEPERVEKTAAMFRTAPLIVAVVSAPRAHDKIPDIEQVLSAGALCLGLLNAAQALGWGGNWLTGPMAGDAAFLKEALDVDTPHFVAGFMVLGSETIPPKERPRPDLDAMTAWVDA
ncbi:MAG: nitroreductase [Pseudomonadota bacterium]